MPKRKTSRIHVIYDSRFAPFPWTVRFVSVFDELGDRLTPSSINDYAGKTVAGVWGKWRVKAVALDDAILQARKYAPCSLRIHKKDGTIQEERSYGAGSESPRKG